MRELILIRFVDRGDVPQEQRAPVVMFSVSDFSQLQCIAACLPHEQVDSLAQIHPPSRPQQVAGIAAVAVAILSVVGEAGWMFC